METNDCGLAALSMVLRFRGVDVELATLRERVRPGRHGVGARELIDLASYYGVNGRAVRVTSDNCLEIPAGSILHARTNHFVVLDGLVGSRLEIVDPRVGRRLISHGSFAEWSSGVALVFDPRQATPLRSRATRAVLARILPNLGRPREWLFLLGLSVLLQAANMLPALAVMVLVNGLHQNKSSPDVVLLLGGLVAAATFMWGRLLRSIAMLRLRQHVDRALTSDVIDHVFSLPMDFFHRRRVGDIMMRIRSTAAVRQALSASVLSGTVDGATSVIAAAITILAAPWLACIVTGFAALQLVILAGSWRHLVSLNALSLEAQAAASSGLEQLLNGAESIKATASQGPVLRFWMATFETELVATSNEGAFRSGIEAAIYSIRLFCPLLLLIVGRHLVDRASLSAGGMLAVVGLASSFLDSSAAVLRTAFDVSLIRATLERLGDVFLTAPESQLGSPLPDDYSGLVELKGVCFSYSTLDPRVLEDVSLHANPGEIVALIGDSGSGKSTIAMTIAGLLTPAAGEVSYDGLARSRINASSLRKMVVLVPQSAFIFGGTIRENIVLGNDQISDEEIEHAVRIAQLEDLIRSLPSKYSTHLGDRGVGLSGGQRQRLAIARAVVRQPRLLILDESTSALDQPTARRVHNEIQRIGCTQIIVTHRSELVAEVDRIYVVNGGRIVDCYCPTTGRSS